MQMTNTARFLFTRKTWCLVFAALLMVTIHAPARADSPCSGGDDNFARPIAAILQPNASVFNPNGRFEVATKSYSDLTTDITIRHSLGDRQLFRAIARLKTSYPDSTVVGQLPVSDGPGFSIQVVEGGSGYTQICTYGFRFQQGIVSYRTLAARAETREGGVYAGNATAWKSVSAPSALVRETATKAAGSPDLVQNQVQESAAFLDFPLKCGDNACAFKYTKGAYTPASVNSVLDHHLTTPYTNEDGVVTAFTGEEGRGEAKNQGCYPPTVQTGSKFSVASLYRGTNDGCLPAQGLNYDSHPGYDYLAGTGTEVYAAAKGKVVTVVNKVTGKSERCIPKGIDKAGCDVWGFIGVDHGNGYITQYGHLSRIYFKSGDLVNAGDLIGLSGQNSPPAKDKNGYITAPYSVPPHLHFEVLKESQAAPYGYAFVDPYGWGGGEDPLEANTGVRSVPLWRNKEGTQAVSQTVDAANAKRTLSPRQAIYSSIGFSGDSRWLVSTDGFELRISETSTLADYRILKTIRSQENTGAGGPFLGTRDGRKLFTGSDGLAVWDTSTWSPIYLVKYPIAGSQLFDGHTMIGLSLDEKTLYGGSIDCVVRSIDPSNGRVNRETRVFSGQAFCGHAISAQGGIVASYELEKGGLEIKFTSLPTVSLVPWSLTASARAYSAKFSPDGTILALGLKDGNIELWDVHLRKMLRRVFFGDGPVMGVAFLSSGKQFVAGSLKANDLKIFDTATGNLLISLPYGSAPFSWTIAISPDGKWLAAAEGKNVHVWSLERLGLYVRK
jgi:murein DD-endopeptidase MepM/ murein hydrolase activator NlpD